ncbi:hypothetical protein BB560_001646 [Smittium megazygosporum]|uniref:isoleucine--tRNA ligase n=1 Tax=Smittium megazygosporum TaxID=133381 RepID=A0A2T9ZH00_9FUNG|nr:hypothetical protein BB560_001646 [Smittium megazygosporum]
MLAKINKFSSPILSRAIIRTKTSIALCHPCFQTPASTTNSLTKSIYSDRLVKLYPGNHGCASRYYSSTVEPSRGNNTYAQTLSLPKTNFSLRANASKREKLFRPNISDKLYPWQLENNSGEIYILSDGPPYANGDLHIGHFLNKTLKDVFNRYHILKKRKVLYIPGWDCHGLPIELKALETLKNKDQDLSGMALRRHAKNLALNTIKKQKKDFKEWGIIGDWEKPYLTMDIDYEARELEVFKHLMKKGYIMRKNSPVYWSPSSKTALAESELEYKSDYLFGINGSENVYFLVWTTTPWTLPANQAIAVNRGFEYTVLENKNESGSPEYYIVASSLAEKMKQLIGDELLNIRYLHHFNGKMYPVLSANYVDSQAGTGLVHTAPGHGKEDYDLCQEHGILPFSPVDDLGNFTDEAGDLFTGKPVLEEGNDSVIEFLRSKRLLVIQKDYVHSYPIDWRTKKPVIIRCTPQWFIDITDLINPTIDSLRDVKMHPEPRVFSLSLSLDKYTFNTLGRNRLVSFVKNRTQWCISRQRPWGTPIPAFYDVETDEPLLTEKSVDHVIKKFKEGKGSNAWWELETEELLADEYKNNGKKYYRKFDTLDVWFDSGTSWTLLHEKFKSDKGQFVADLYLEGSDQHRGWFQSSLLTSSAVQKVAPFKNLFTHGFLLDENGFKMSKSIGNTVSPSKVINGEGGSSKDQGYGVDVLRLWVGLYDSSNDMQIGF